jgi:hypothetical protein
MMDKRGQSGLIGRDVDEITTFLKTYIQITNRLMFRHD